MQSLEVSGAVRPIYGSLGVKQLNLVLRLVTAKLWKVNITTLLNLSIPNGGFLRALPTTILQEYITFAHGEPSLPHKRRMLIRFIPGIKFQHSSFSPCRLNYFPCWKLVFRLVQKTVLPRPWIILKMRAASSSQTQETNYQSTRHHTAEDCNIHPTTMCKPQTTHCGCCSEILVLMSFP